MRVGTSARTRICLVAWRASVSYVLNSCSVHASAPASLRACVAYVLKQLLRVEWHKKWGPQRACLPRSEHVSHMSLNSYSGRERKKMGVAESRSLQRRSRSPFSRRHARGELRMWWVMACESGRWAVGVAGTLSLLALLVQ